MAVNTNTTQPHRFKVSLRANTRAPYAYVPPAWEQHTGAGVSDSRYTSVAIVNRSLARDTTTPLSFKSCPRG